MTFRVSTVSVGS